MEVGTLWIEYSKELCVFQRQAIKQKDMLKLNLALFCIFCLELFWFEGFIKSGHNPQKNILTKVSSAILSPESPTF